MDKNQLKECVIKCIAFVLRPFRAKYIIFKSNPDFCDNTAAVYDYIVNNHIDLKYEPIWFIADKQNKKKGIKTCIDDNFILNKLKCIYYICRSKLIIFCNARVDKLYDSQKSIYLTHGSIAKNIVGKCAMSEELDYCLVQSEYLKPVSKEGFSLSEHTKMIILGFPRNDDLLIKHLINRNALFDTAFEKLIVWYPTFRQHKVTRERNVSSISLPIIYDKKDAVKINEYAKSKGILIVLKPHFAQDTSYIRDAKLSNIVIIDDEFLQKNNIRSYQLLGISDALITDYSSVYYDYLLTDRPIGLTWDDYDEYAEKEGFSVDMDVIFAGGEKIYNNDDFCCFLKNVADGNDVLREERNKVKDLTNYYQDENSSKRVADFILGLATEEIGGNQK